MKFVLCASLAAFALSGCMSAGTKLSDAQVNQFQRGVTTEAQIEAKLGEPTSTLKQSGGVNSITYSHVDARPDAVDFVPIVGMFAGGAQSHVDSVTFVFDNSGVLKEITSTTASTHVKTGLAQ